MSAQRRAFLVCWPGNEDAAPDEIVFATSPSDAKAHSEAYGNEGKGAWTELRATRAPEFDRYVESGSIPQTAYLDNGWSVTCQHLQCGVMVTEEDAGVVDGQVFCKVHAHQKAVKALEIGRSGGGRVNA